MSDHRFDPITSPAFMSFARDCFAAGADEVARKRGLDPERVAEAKAAWNVLGEREVVEAQQLLNTAAVQRAIEVTSSPRVRSACAALYRMAETIATARAVAARIEEIRP
ncbi:hypothetical protein [Luteimonas terricola]|uniref:Phasin domain-containing protein n=1 Tax=Luteimonas terricola TaxID=645597 RepID=A0ABQ2EF03_9GAMM|nr:hypothetical protein [Luteimonas terricola]GGK08736.1 hypothetical protein GCM10011394_17670 [Luteimonas terricola]